MCPGLHVLSAHDPFAETAIPGGERNGPGCRSYERFRAGPSRYQVFSHDEDITPFEVQIDLSAIPVETLEKSEPDFPVLSLYGIRA